MARGKTAGSKAEIKAIKSELREIKEELKRAYEKEERVRKEKLRKYWYVDMLGAERSIVGCRNCGERLMLAMHDEETMEKVKKMRFCPFCGIEKKF